MPQAALDPLAALPARLDDLRRVDGPEAEVRRPLLDDAPSLFATIFLLALPRDLLLLPLLLLVVEAFLSVLAALRARVAPARLSVEGLLRRL